MPKVRLIAAYGALGPTYSYGVKNLVDHVTLNPNVQGSVHFYGALFGLIRGAARFAKLAQQARPAYIVLAGHSLGADEMVRTAWRLNELGIMVELIYACDPTPFVWTIPPNVKQVWNPYNNLTGQLGGGRVREHRSARGIVDIEHNELAVPHVKMDDLIEYHLRMREFCDKLTER